jgi:FAD/FMN-containing dehydrogenase
MVELQITTTTGTQAALEATAVEELKESLRGRLLRTADDGYDQARKVWNGMTDKRPALIIQCAGVADVINSVNFARDNGLLVAVRGGGHSIAGHSVCEGGILIDLSLMKSIRVDPVNRTARAEGGAKWGDFDHATQAFSLATTGGTNSDTGIAGLTLGGGLGWLAGKYGLACDNLLSVDVITADGRYLTASGHENQDLFWGLRGGSGNFGVVTSFEYQLHKVGPVLAGMVVYPFEKAKEVLKFYSEFSSNIPDELNTVGALLASPEGSKVVAIAVCYNGPINQGEEVLRPLQEFGPPLANQIASMPYMAIQTALDGSFPRGRQYYWRASLIKQIGNDAIDTIVDYFAAVPSPFSLLGFQQLGNAANRVGQNDTAFSHRDALYDFLMLSGWEDPSEAEGNIQWTREVSNSMEPSLHGGFYVNGLGEDAESRVRNAYLPETYQRLVTLKKKYDPKNLFRLNPNIKPAV